jgi:hypothetical protein
MTRRIYSPVALSLSLIFALAGCSKEAQQSDAGQSSSSGSGYNNSGSSRPAVENVEIPSGTTLIVALDERLSTETNQAGDRFKGHTTNSIVIDQTTVLPAGSTVRGHLTHVEEPHRTTGKAEMTLAFDEIVDASGKTHSISSGPIALVGKGDAISDEEKVAGGAVIGGIIGALTSKNKGKGAAVGAAAGAAAGGAVALATKSGQLELPPGQRFEVELTRSVEMQVASR